MTVEQEITPVNIEGESSVTFDPTTRELSTLAGKCQRLSKKQTPLFITLVGSPNQIISYKEAMGICYPGEELTDHYCDLDRLQVLVQRARHKLRAVSPGLDERLQTVFARGYRWE